MHAQREESLSEAMTVRCPDTGLFVSMRPLEAHATGAWRDLAERLLVPNIFYEPDFAIPALAVFGAGVKAISVAEGPEEDARLLGLWPVRVSTHRWILPLPVLLGWTHPFSPLGVPLLDRTRAEEAWTALLNAPRILSGLPARALLPLVPDQGPFDALTARLRERLATREARLGSHVRPALSPANRANYLESRLSAATRSKLRQELRRIERQGEVSFETITDPEALRDAVNDYIALEARGWKARQGTALSCSAEEATFLRRATNGLAQAGRLRADRLRLNGTTIASSLTYFSGSQAWYVKISYDESQAKNSPGSQLVVHVTNAFLADPAITYADSCAPVGHPLMRRFWGEDLAISHRLVELAGGDPLFPLAVALERVRLRSSDLLRQMKLARRLRRERIRRKSHSSTGIEA